MVEDMQIKAACEALQVDDVPVYNTKRHCNVLFKS
jgi:hypothetical protein